MDIKEIAIPVDSYKLLRQLILVLRELGVPLDPCSEEPLLKQDGQDQLRLHIIAIPRVEEELKLRNYKYDVIRDFVDAVDPREYTSRVNRYEETLLELREKQGIKSRVP